MDYKGLTIQFDGDASKLLGVLRQIDSQATATQTNLGKISAALKLDPSSATLYTAQTRLLNTAINEESAHLKKLQSEHEKTNTSLSRAKQRMKELEQAGKQNSEEYGNLQRKCAEWESQLESLGDKIAISKAEIEGYRKELEATTRVEFFNTNPFGRMIEGAEQFGQSLYRLGGYLTNVIGLRLTMMESAVLAGFGRSVINEAEEYGNAISQVGGYLEITGAQLEEMSELALYWGKETQFSATEAADAMSELAKGGMTDAQIKGGALEATMQLAAAGGISMADAATVAVNAIKVFGLSAENATDVADALAGAANKSTAEIYDLSSSFRYVSGWAGLADYSINDVAGALGLLADYGLTGQIAGTGLRNVLQRLAAPTGKAADLMEQYGLQVYDANGKMKGIVEIVSDLNTAFADLDDETRNGVLNTIFGARGLPAAVALMEAGTDQLQDYISATEREGYALEMMNARMGDLGWALEYLRGEYETFKVSIGKAFEPFIIEVVNAIEDLLSEFNSWDPSRQREFVSNILRLAAIGPGMLALGTAFKVVGAGIITVSRLAKGLSELYIASESGIGMARGVGNAMNAISGGAIAAESGIAALSFGLLALAGILAGVKYAEYVFETDKARKRTEKLERATSGLVDAVDDIDVGDAIEGLDLFGETARETASDIDTLIDKQSELQEAISERNEDAQEDISTLERARRLIQLYGDGSELSAQQLADLQWALDTVNAELGTSYKYNDDLNKIYDDQGEVIDDLIGHIDDLIAAREREIKAEVIEDNMKDLYAAQPELIAGQEEAQKNFDEARDAFLKARDEWLVAKAQLESGDITENDFYGIDYDYRQAEQEYETAASELETANAMLLANEKAIEESRQELASVLEEGLSEADQIAGALKATLQADGDAAEKARSFFDILINKDLEDGIEDVEDLAAALADAGVNLDALSQLSPEILSEMLGDSKDVGEFIDRFKEWSDTVPIVSEETKRAAEAVEELGTAADGVATPVTEAIDDIDSAYEELQRKNRDYSDIWSNDGSIKVEYSVEADEDSIYQFMQWLETTSHKLGNVEPIVVEADTTEAQENLDELNASAQEFSDMQIPKKKTSASVGGNMIEFIRQIVPGWKNLNLGSKQGTAIVYGNLSQSTSDLKEWNRLGMESKWGQATIAVAIQSKSVKLGDGGMLYRHADGYITNHSLYSGNHVIGEAGIEAVLPLNNRAATQPLVDAIADGVSSRIGGGNQYNLYINDARVNDDPAIRSAFIDLMGAVNRKGMQTNAAR